MRKWARAAAWLALLGGGGVAAISPARAETIVIATGSTTGVYFQLGRALCRLVSQHPDGLTCRPRESAGSMANLEDVSSGAVEFGIAQSDVQYHAVKGTGPFEFIDIPYDNLRAVFSVHGEPFTVVARRDSGISRLTDLPGRRVNIGNPGSGQRATMQIVMRALGWRKSDFLLAEELPADQQSLALCHGRVEAMVYTVGHPNLSIGKTAALCDAVLVEVSGDPVDALVREHPYYSHVTIPGGTYAGTPHDTRTFGVRATLVTSSEVPAATVRALVGAVFDHFERFRRMHPAFGALERGAMTSEGLAAPLHEGAVAYYREHGLM